MMDDLQLMLDAERVTRTLRAVVALVQSADRDVDQSLNLGDLANMLSMVSEQADHVFAALEQQRRDAASAADTGVLARG